MHLSQEKLIEIAELCTTGASFADIAKATGISESIIYTWRAACERHQRENDLSSPFYIEFRGEKMWFTQAVSMARKEHLCTGESILRTQSVHGVEEIVRGPSQEILYQKNPMYIGRSDTFVMFSEGCEEADVAYHRLAHDANGHPIPETIRRQLPAQLRLRVLEASHDDYKPKSSLDVNVTGTVTHEAKPVQRKPGEKRVDLQELRALAALTPEQRRAKIGGSKFPLDASGRRTLPAMPSSAHADEPDDASRGVKRAPAPAPYVPPPRPEPQQEPVARPSYAKVRSEDHYGRGEPAPGGGPANAPGNVRR